MCSRTSVMDPPVRPLVPTSLYALVAALIAERAVLTGGDGGRGVELALGSAGALAVCLALRRLRGVEAPSAVIACCAAACYAALSASALLASEAACAQALGSSAVSGWEFRVLVDTTEDDYGYRCRATALRDGRSLGEVWLSVPEPLMQGQVVSGIGRFSREEEGEWAASMRCRGIVGNVRIVHVEDVRWAGGIEGMLSRLRSTIIERVEPGFSPERALLAGIACGSQTELSDSQVEEDFAACGLSHLIAVSGSHLALIAAMLGGVLASSGLRPAAREGLLAATTGSFVLFCGAPASAVRSWLMSMAASGSELAGRRGHALSAVCIASCCMCLARPACAGDIGFLLSVASVVGITLLGSYFVYACEVLLDFSWPRGTPSWLRRRGDAVARAIRSSVAITLVAQLATIPVTVPLFGRVSLIAPLANLLIGPLFAVTLALGILSCCLCPVPVVGKAALAVSDAACAVTCSAAHGLACVPLASVPVVADERLLWAVTALIAAAVVALWPPLSRRRIAVPVGAALIVICLLFVRWRFLMPARVCVLDVGQGDAILIQDGASAILVDAGPGDAVVDALAREHVFHLDAVVITHLHDDHFGGVEHLAGVVDVEAVYVGDGVSDDEPPELSEAIEGLTGGDSQELGYHDRMRVGGFVLEVVSPTEETDGSENGDSIEMTLSYDEGGRAMEALLTGDAEQNEMASLLERGEVGDIDFLKVGHHGSEVSLTSEQARALAPEVSVASAGEGNRYGHPARECVSVLEGAGSRFVCTIEAGDVELRPDAGGIRVSY